MCSVILLYVEFSAKLVNIKWSPYLETASGAGVKDLIKKQAVFLMKNKMYKNTNTAQCLEEALLENVSFLKTGTTVWEDSYPR